jgi:hypothetical protein
MDDDDRSEYVEKEEIDWKQFADLLLESKRTEYHKILTFFKQKEIIVQTPNGFRDTFLHIVTRKAELIIDAEKFKALDAIRNILYNHCDHILALSPSAPAFQQRIARTTAEFMADIKTWMFKNDDEKRTCVFWLSIYAPMFVLDRANLYSTEIHLALKDAFGQCKLHDEFDLFITVLIIASCIHPINTVYMRKVLLRVGSSFPAG